MNTALSAFTEVLSHGEVRIGVGAEAGLDLIEDALGGGREPGEVIPESVASQFALDEAPDPFNQVELRAIGRQPQDADARRLGGEPRAKLGGLVIGRIVEHQDQMVVRPAFDHAREEDAKVLGVPRGGQLAEHNARPIVERAERGYAPVGSGGGYAPGFPPSSPGFRQVGMGVKLALVQVEQSHAALEMSPFF